jgi:hypothetical protein
VTLSSIELLAAAPVVAVLVDHFAAGVAATCRRRRVLHRQQQSGSPSGSTQPGSTGTVTVPPRATSGVGQGHQASSRRRTTSARGIAVDTVSGDVNVGR